MNEVPIISASGPDGFPAILLRKCSGSLAHPLYIIWRKSMNQGIIPKSCKCANIIPIHKGKSRAEAKNYRPVALTCILIKTFEKVVRKPIVSFLEEHLLFNAGQHGFRAAHSCLSQLLAHFDLITRHLEDGKAVDVIYLDFAKAFDKLDIGITLKKLEAMGIGGHLGQWLQSFLSNRSQTVVVNGVKSSPKPVLSGVPQGSVIGPLIFLILIGDIDKEVATSFISSFADDTRIGHEISSEEDIKALQLDLQAVYQWATNNNMEFNSEKFELIQYRSVKTNGLLSTHYTLLWAVMRYLHSILQKRSHLWSSKLDGSYAPSKPVTRNPWWHYGNHWSSVNMTIVASYGTPTELATSNHLNFFNTHLSRKYMECFTSHIGINLVTWNSTHCKEEESDTLLSIPGKSWKVSFQTFLLSQASMLSGTQEGGGSAKSPEYPQNPLKGYRTFAGHLLLFKDLRSSIRCPSMCATLPNVT